LEDFLKSSIIGFSSTQIQNSRRMPLKKARVLILGGGAVGAIAAVNLEVGGLAEVTAVLRSNFKAVDEKGYIIKSIDHGKLTGWRPTKGMQ
jgi:glutamate dehydrogenase/leucine dehydrogenase